MLVIAYFFLWKKILKHQMMNFEKKKSITSFLSGFRVLLLCFGWFLLFFRTFVNPL